MAASFRWCGFADFFGFLHARFPRMKKGPPLGGPFWFLDLVLFYLVWWKCCARYFGGV
jgi:hypothetical protein